MKFKFLILAVSAIVATSCRVSDEEPSDSKPVVEVESDSSGVLLTDDTITIDLIDLIDVPPGEPVFNPDISLEKIGPNYYKVHIK